MPSVFDLFISAIIYIFTQLKRIFSRQSVISFQERCYRLVFQVNECISAEQLHVNVKSIPGTVVEMEWNMATLVHHQKVLQSGVNNNLFRIHSRLWRHLAYEYRSH